MRAFLAFSKKEVTENLRTQKILIMFAVFIIFGLLSPLTAKFTPEILKSLGGIDPAALGMANPTAVDSWVQFFKNLGGIGLIVLAIVFSGLMANEFSKGTFINILTKGLNRSSVIFSKFVVSAIIWTLSYIICVAITWAYTAYYFDKVDLNNGFLAFFALWLYGVLIISLLIFGGVLFKNVYGSLLVAGGVAIILSLCNIIPKAEKYNPATLTSVNMALLTAKKMASDINPAVIICFCLIIIMLLLSVLVFNKKQI